MSDSFRSLLATTSNYKRLKTAESSLDLHVVRAGIPPAIIIINGFLSKDNDDVSDWLSIVDELYPKNQVIHAKWNAGNIKSLAKDDGLLGNNGKIGTLFGTGSLKALLANAALMAVDKTAGHWNKAFAETRRVGIKLAAVIQDKPELRGELNGCILMGHSLGARVAYHTLANLNQSHVKAAYFLAGAVSAEPEEWFDIFGKHSETTFINCMSQKDSTLKYGYSAGCLFDHKPIGLSPLDENSCANVMNIDVSEHAEGHQQFKNIKVGQYINSQLLKDKNTLIRAANGTAI